MEKEPTPARLFWQGYRSAAPLMVGVAPFGLVFGALAVGAGMSAIQALGMSIFVIAGSSQFVATGLIKDGAPFVVIVLTTFIINLRHFLYSASLADFLQPLPQRWKMLIAYEMIDEVYAPSMIRHRQGDLSPFQWRWYFLGAGFNLSTIWWTTTVIGAKLGDILNDDTRDALGFTLPLIFISIVVPLLVKRPPLLAAVTAITMGIVLNPLPYRLGLILAAGLGIVVGVISEGWQPQSEEKSA